MVETAHATSHYKCTRASRVVKLFRHWHLFPNHHVHTPAHNLHNYRCRVINHTLAHEHAHKLAHKDAYTHLRLISSILIKKSNAPSSMSVILFLPARTKCQWYCSIEWFLISFLGYIVCRSIWFFSVQTLSNLSFALLGTHTQGAKTQQKNSLRSILTKFLIPPNCCAVNIPFTCEKDITKSSRLVNPSQNAFEGTVAKLCRPKSTPVTCSSPCEQVLSTVEILTASSVKSSVPVQYWGRHTSPGWFRRARKPLTAYHSQPEQFTICKYLVTYIYIYTHTCIRKQTNNIHINTERK